MRSLSHEIGKDSFVLRCHHYLDEVFQEFACNGCVTEHEKYGLVISLQGDHRSGVSETLVKTGICRHDQIKEHGF